MSNHDTNEDTIEETILTTEQEFSQKINERLGRVRMNILESIVGIILLVICFNYLKNHPAEKTSMFTSLEMITQKVQLFFGGILGNGKEEMSSKFGLERNFEDLIGTMEGLDCIDETIKKDAAKKLSDLKSLKVADFVSVEKTYIGYARSYAKKIQDCE